MQSMNKPRQVAPQPASQQGEQTTQAECTPLLIDATKAASILSLGKRTLWGMTQRGAIPCVRVGRRVLYRPCELEAWVAAGAPDTPGSGDYIRESMREGGR